MEILAKIILIGAFLILFLNASGFREELQIRSSAFFHRLLSCDFCLSWWVSLSLALIFALVAKDYTLMLNSVLATPLINFLIR